MPDIGNRQNARPRVLLAITVYNGRGFVPRCLDSAKHIESERADLDVLVLDDCSPEPGFSAWLSELCRRQGVFYYRSPRNLGIVRNVNLGLLSALEHGYDYVIISNSDVIYSKQVVDHLLEAATTDENIGSVTAWSNNVSVYSIPNSDPDKYLSSQEVVDWLTAALAGDYRKTAVDIPAGISFCVLIPARVIRDVGLMDPVFGRGYCEETDWSLRSLARGYRVTLAPAAFVYHQGRGSTLAAGMVSGGHTTVPANEAIIDYRYPLFRGQVDAFLNGGILDTLRRSAVHGIIRDAGAQFGYDLQLSGPRRAYREGLGEVLVTFGDTAGPRLQAEFRGFELELPSWVGSSAGELQRFFNGEPRGIYGDPRRPFIEAPAGQLGSNVQLPKPTYPPTV